MALHLNAFWENQDGAGTEQELAIVTDTRGIMSQGANADYFRVSGRFNKIAGAWANITTTVFPRVRFQSPSLDETFGRDQTFLPFINGGTGDVEPGSPQAFNDFRADPIPLKAGEDLRVLTVNNPAAASDQSVLAIFTDGVVQPVDPKGGFWARATTSASALTAGAWGARSVSFTTPLRTGWYELLAGRVSSTSLIGAGAVFESGSNRVPLYAVDNGGDLPHRSFEVPGQWGQLGVFHTNTPFTLDLLANDADNEAQECFFYVRPTQKPSWAKE